MRRIPIGKGYYEVDDKKKTFRYMGPNKYWEKLTYETNKRNREAIDGYTRLNKDGSKVKFRNKK